MEVYNFFVCGWVKDIGIKTLPDKYASFLLCMKDTKRARQSVWWPRLSQQLNELVLNCQTCCKERQNHKETLMPSPYPGRPWEKLGADLFMLCTKTYLLVVDYMSNGGPQFSGAGFTEFAESYGFRHVTSSPRYPQGAE
ncbi:uncharacterized protein clasp1b isoform X3 [Entelurus aequoreus]|uniref:uncharacterized protein clasp1b isoform X3 n=1 Tax=Entelurus aequoreus TaxID=161455 RepID=UPI002B1E6CAF|nr:uncharacterized protein clasp1b isoform X3 [Entelurus aequoreus]